MFAVAFLIANGMVAKNITSAEDNVRNLNLALMKRASQSSTFKSTRHDNGPHRAVDGNTLVQFDMCTKTDWSDGWHWWMVDLCNKYTIKSVVATIVDNKISNEFRIEVSCEDPATLTGFPGPTNASLCLKNPTVQSIFGSIESERSGVIVCDEPVTGRYVRVMATNNHNRSHNLVLCEFEVYSHIEKSYIKPQRSTNSLAYKKETRQSSIGAHGKSNRAVDGNLFGRYKSLSCTHTSTESTSHWWFVDLGALYVVESVSLVNRFDCFQDRLQKFTIHVSTKDPTTIPEFPEKMEAVMCHNQTNIIPYRIPVNFKCDTPVVGRYVLVVKGGLALTLCEVEVFGKQEKAEKQWHLEYVTSYELNQQVIASVPKKAANCAALYEGEKIEVKKYPFIQVDLKTGDCRFLQNVSKAFINLKSSWILYKYLN